MRAHVSRIYAYYSMYVFSVQLCACGLVYRYGRGRWFIDRTQHGKHCGKYGLGIFSTEHGAQDSRIYIRFRNAFLKIPYDQQIGCDDLPLQAFGHNRFLAEIQSFTIHNLSHLSAHNPASYLPAIKPG